MEVTGGGVVLPTVAQEKLYSGVVFAVGDAKFDRMCEVTQEGMDDLIGKRVIWSSYSGETLHKAVDGCGEIIQVNVNHVKAEEVG